MAVSFCHISQQSLPFPPPKLPSRLHKATKIRASSSPASVPMDLHNQGRQKFMEFPFVSAPQRDLMKSLVSSVEDRLGSQLLPCSLPLDVQHCQSANGTAQASLHMRSGHHSSPVDLILGSWLHCELPTGAALNITSLSGYLKPSTDAPNFLFELIQSSPTSLIMILDLPPRKDLVLHPEYLQTFYESTQLEKHRQVLEKLPEVTPYFTSSLYLRCILSPTVIMIRIETNEAATLEDMIKNKLDPIAKEVVGIWLEHCVCKDRDIGEEERAYLKKRDQLIKSKTIEIDLGSNFPRLFGPEIASRVLGAIQDGYNL